MDCKFFERVDGCFGPLPYIANHIKEIAMIKLINRTRGRAMIQVKVSRSDLILRHRERLTVLVSQP